MADSPRSPITPTRDPTLARAQPEPEPDLLPPHYPQQWAADVVLRDGGTCHVRPIIPADREALQDFHLAQSDRSRYLRFFAPLPRLSERDLDRFTQVDYTRRVALVAIVAGRIVGVGRYDVIDPGEAEVAFNIADSQQGRGLGSVLLEHLSAAARERGVRRFIAEVLPENRKMVRVFADAGYEVRHHFDDGVISLEFGIEPTTRSMEVVASRERRAEAASLRALLQAQSVAVIGASDEPSSLGRRVVQNLQEGGFVGPIYPIHPTAGSVCGLPAHASVHDITDPIDIAVLAVGSSAVASVAVQCGAAGVRGLVVITDGFVGAEGHRIERELARMSRAAGMRVLGPASLGIVNTSPQVRLNASLLPLKLTEGGLALFSQSAGLGLVLLAEAHERGLGVASVVSAGDRADVSGNDLLQYWAEDERTRVIAMYTESSGNPRKFFRIARAVSAAKPIVMVRSWTTNLAAHSTTGRESLAPRKAFNAVLHQAGVIRAEDVHQLVHIVHLLLGQPLPRGTRVGVVTNSAVLASLVHETCENFGLSPVDEPITVSPLTADSVRAAIEEAGAQGEVDSLVVVLVPHLSGFDPGVLDAVRESAAAQQLPTVACLVAHQVVTGSRADLGDVPVYSTPEDAVRALSAVTRYARWRHRDHGVPVDPEGCYPERAQAMVAELLAAHPEGLVLDPPSTRALLECYGVSMIASERVLTVEEGVSAAARLGYPVACKYANQVLRERRDVTGARLGIDDEEELLIDLEEMLDLDDPAVAEGFIIQPMVASGVAVDVRTVEDPLFGPILSFGLSGDATELLDDVAYRIPPLTEVDVADLVREIKASPRLFGYGGAARLDVEGVQDLIARVSRLAEDIPEVAELDLRPVLVAVESVNPLWARVRLAPPPARVDSGMVRRL